LLCATLPEDCFSQKRWWQLETLSQPANHIVNPAYLSKKGALQIELNVLIKDANARNHFRALGQKTPSIDASIKYSLKKVAELEYELSKIPRYVVIADANNASLKSSNITTSEVLVTGVRRFAADWTGFRIRFDRFRHFADPNGIDYRSYKKLGEPEAYIIRLYPSTAMKDITGALEFSQELRNSASLSFTNGKRPVVTIMRNKDQYAQMNLRNARDLTSIESKTAIDNLIKNGAIFQINIQALPPYADIPLPAGTYYLEYSLWFPSAKNSIFTYCHPNYKGVSIDERPEVSTSWGPAKVNVVESFVSEFQFRPTLAISGYEFLNHPIKRGVIAFENSDAFWDWISFIRWKGAWNPGDEQ